MDFKLSIILRIIGEICEHIGKVMRIAQKNNAQIYEHNSLIPSSGKQWKLMSLMYVHMCVD